MFGDSVDYWFRFRNKTEAEEFLRRIRKMAYKYDIVVWNDILKDRNMHPLRPEGFEFGYNRETIKKLKIDEVDGEAVVHFPTPGLLVRDGKGRWSIK